MSNHIEGYKEEATNAIPDAERARAGDRAAFDRLAQEVWPALYRLCLSFLREPQDAQDIAQESLLRAWLHLPQFRGDASFSTWVLTIGANLCRNARKRPQRAVPLGDGLSSTEASPERQVMARDDIRWLQAALDRLRPVERSALLLVTQEGVPYDEAARILDLPVGTVKTHVHRARKALRASLQNVEPDGGAHRAAHPLR